MKIKELMLAAYRVAATSPDPSTQTGAVIEVESQRYMACNRIHSSIEQNYVDRDFKYNWVTHAESGAIYLAAKHGAQLFGATMVCPWAACNRCAISIVESGIAKLVLHKQRMDIASTWDSQIRDSLKYLRRNLDVLYFDEHLPEAPQILISGQLWQP